MSAIATAWVISRPLFTVTGFVTAGGRRFAIPSCDAET